MGDPVVPKRQRRPSVRLGDIGDTPSSAYANHHHHHRNHPKPPSYSKTRPLTNLVSTSGASPDTTIVKPNKRIDPADPEATNNTAFEEEGSPANSEEGTHKRSSSRSSIRASELDEGVSKWLLKLGMERYAAVFEIHEVDEEVLPHLTLEDLKDMGITAVGSRRKLYTAILNLTTPDLYCHYLTAGLIAASLQHTRGNKGR